MLSQNLTNGPSIFANLCNIWTTDHSCQDFVGTMGSLTLWRGLYLYRGVLTVRATRMIPASHDDTDSFTFISICGKFRVIYL